MKSKIDNANFPHTADRRVYHVGVKHGEVANRILTVGDPVRARRIAQHLDASPQAFECTSQRGFTTFTGRFKGVPVSIIAIGMGYPMMDSFVRETRAVVTGDLIIIRFGSCGTLVPEIPVGRIVVCSRALAILTNYDYFQLKNQKDNQSPTTASASSPYLISKPIYCDKNLHDNLTSELRKALAGQEVVSDTLHAGTDSFYSSQGRLDSNFADQNQDLLDNLKNLKPAPVTLEMETSHLFFLANITHHNPLNNPVNSDDESGFCQGKGKIRAAAAHMTFAGRVKGDFISPEQVEHLEHQAGQACLETLIQQAIDPNDEHPVKGSVWEI
ncbi:hypothetical protein O181_087776 [Austropuccinia psidii MF-1]|uniref:Nucleoside phosphorylase domain-containing protein n=1 Tax=Austropuccinia psidii MF-1 TaxID=1389203 RepID=A0A9Q3P630_9BASI|nr:hypothetical protein [Austropuccinia psidii MF-1]